MSEGKMKDIKVTVRKISKKDAAPILAADRRAYAILQLRNINNKAIRI